MPKKFSPGEHSPKSGQYEMVGPRGGKTGIERTIVNNKRFPPTLEEGQKYILVDPTKTK